ncbi:MAG: transposase family protein [Methanomicrobiaceae archaeon]|nr:transposase family protein [Methanomicrobiaceae archaeon]
MKKVAIPPMVADIIMNGISNLNGIIFDSVNECPCCGGQLKGHDTKNKKFATLIENNQQKNIFVNVKRYRCKDCKKLVYSDSPFYDDIRIGSPIVDFCILNLKMHPANHISKILRNMNIAVNPSTIRKFNTLKTGEIKSIEFHGIAFPLSLLNISENIRNDESLGINAMIVQMVQGRPHN